VDVRALLAVLGRRGGYAVTVARQRKFLLADTVVELTFACRSDDSFFAAAAGHHDCALALDGVVPGDEGALVYFVTLTGADASAVVEWATERPAVVDARLVRDYGDEALLELVVDGQDLSRLLVERGATLQEMHAEEGRQELVVGVPAESDVRTLVDDVTAAVAGTELLTKRERGRTAESRPAFRSSLREELTDKQAAVLQAAYHAGYFEWPRGSTAEELADAIGITSPTLHNHLRRAQQKLLTAFFQEDHPAAETTPWNGE
jgi:predicted DNA binding protein